MASERSAIFKFVFEEMRREGRHRYQLAARADRESGKRLARTAQSIAEFNQAREIRRTAQTNYGLVEIHVHGDKIMSIRTRTINCSKIRNALRS
jgi:hypothetical protein